MRRRLCAGVTLLAYLVAAIGFPMPTAKANACGKQVCGCAAAQTCQTGGCCCMPKPADPDDDDVPSCCVKKKPSCCTKDPATPVKPGAVRWVIGMSAQKCQGGATHWISAQAALPGPMPLDWQPSWPYCHDVYIARENQANLSILPIDPPPRSAVI